MLATPPKGARYYVILTIGPGDCSAARAVFGRHIQPPSAGYFARSRVSVQLRLIEMFLVKKADIQEFAFKGTLTVTETVCVVVEIVLGLTVTVADFTEEAVRVALAALMAWALVAPGTIARRAPW
jgi:hypothetical protein